MLAFVLLPYSQNLRKSGKQVSKIGATAEFSKSPATPSVCRFACLSSPSRSETAKRIIISCYVCFEVALLCSGCGLRITDILSSADGPAGGLQTHLLLAPRSATR